MHRCGRCKLVREQPPTRGVLLQGLGATAASPSLRWFLARLVDVLDEEYTGHVFFQGKGTVFELPP
jgi:hypothetical protein